MKTPLVLSLLILAVGAAIGWNDHQRLAVVRQTHARTVAEAAKRGIFPDSSDEAAVARATKRQRENREAAARLLATDYIEFAKQKDALPKKRGEPDEAFVKRGMELEDRMASLDSVQLKIVITEVCACLELKDRTRDAFLYNAITIFADKHPQAALAFFTEAPDLFEGSPRGGHLVSIALRCWSEDDPLAAMEWVLQNGGSQSPLLSEDTKRDMVSAAARRDPALAFELIGRMEMKDVDQMQSAVSEVIGAAATPEKRTAALTALRGYLPTIKDEKSREYVAASSILSLGRYVSQDGFDAATRWVASADMTPKELAIFASGLNHQIATDPRFDSAETGRWVEWVGKALPAAQGDKTIKYLVSQWTAKDYQAAGIWLGNAPDGPSKKIAIRSYAETVAKYEPEAAAQWALTLPAGKERDQTLKSIYTSWPDEDPAGKQAFADKHQLW